MLCYQSAPLNHDADAGPLSSGRVLYGALHFPPLACVYDRPFVGDVRRRMEDSVLTCAEHLCGLDRLRFSVSDACRFLHYRPQLAVIGVSHFARHLSPRGALIDVCLFSSLPLPRQSHVFATCDVCASCRLRGLCLSHLS